MTLHLVHLLLFVHTELSWAHVDQQQEATPWRYVSEWGKRRAEMLNDLHNRQDLKEIVFSKIFVRMVRMQLGNPQF